MAAPSATAHQIKESLRFPQTADKRRTYPVSDNDYSINKLGTANAVGLITTLIMTNVEANLYAQFAGGARTFDLLDNTGAVKATGTGKTITTVALNTPTPGQATVTFSPAAAGTTASGDYMVPAGSEPEEYLTIKGLDERLAVIAPSVYSGAAGVVRLSSMTTNDKQYAVRQFDDVGSGSGI